MDAYNALIFVLFFLFPDKFIIEITDKPHFNFFPTAAIGYYFYTIAFSASLMVTFLNLVQAYRSSQSILFREQIKYFMFGMIVGFGGGSTNILAVFVKSVYPFGCFSVALFAALLAYTIVKHTLIGVDVFIKRGLLYLGLILVLFIPSALLIQYFQNVLLSDISNTFTLVVLSIFLFFAYSFYKLNQLVEPRLIKISGGKGYNYEQILKRVNFSVNNFSNLKDVLNYLSNIISETIDVKNVSVFQQIEGDEFVLVGCSEEAFKVSLPPSLKMNEALLADLRKEEAILFKDDYTQAESSFKGPNLREEFDKVSGEIIIPIKSESDLKGLLVVSERNKKDLYSNNDVNALKVFSDHIANILNVQSYKVIESLNEDLKEKSDNLEKAVIELKNTQAQLVHSAKLASVGQLAAGVAHELNNALNVTVLGNLALKKTAKKNEKNEVVNDFKNGMNILDDGIGRAQKVIKDLLTFSKKDSEGYQYQDIHEGIESSLNILTNELEGRIKVHKDFCDLTSVFCDLNQLNQVFLNLFKNASDAIPDKGDLWIKTIKKDDFIQISIHDNGAGISEEDMGSIFDPFFTTKGVGKGTGLGLSVSYNIISDHHGKIECSSTEGHGTEFLITLPIDFNKTLKKDDAS